MQLAEMQSRRSFSFNYCEVICDSACRL